jgi:PAB1-binding protein PBP1
MTKLVLRCVTQGTFLIALIAALSCIPAFAMGGGGGGGLGAGGVPAGLLRLDPQPSPPSSYPRRSGIKATHKIKKNIKQSSSRRPGL